MNSSFYRIIFLSSLKHFNWTFLLDFSFGIFSSGIGTTYVVTEERR